MNHNEYYVDILQKLSKCVQQMQLKAMEGRKEEYRSFLPLITELQQLCFNASLSVCIFQKNIYPTSDNQTMSVQEITIEYWPVNGDAAVHAHIICVFRFRYAGHFEMHPEGIEIHFVKYQAVDRTTPSPPSDSSPPEVPEAPHEGGIISDEEMRRFLKSLGLEDLDKK